MAEPATVPPDGGRVTVAVTSERDCPWSASSTASWLTVSAASGQGSGSFTAVAASNDQPAVRTGSIAVNDQQIAITQEARACTYAVEGPPGPLAPSAGPGSVQVSTLQGCTWTAISSASWLVVRTTSGSGPATVDFDVQANPGPEREASITIAGRTVVVAQGAAAAPPCSFAIAPPSQDFPASGGEATVTVSTNPECQWTVTGGTAWTTVLTTTGTGSGEVTYRVTAHTSGTSRQTTLTIAGRVHTVTQQGAACTFTVTPPALTFDGSGGTGTVTVGTAPDCAWTASSNAGWAVLGAATGSGPGQLSYQVLPNPLSTPRTAAITVGGQIHSVTQTAGTACTYTLTPPSATVGDAGATASVHVTTQPGCAWTAAASDPWVTVSPATTSGAGDADIGYTVAANTTTAERTATLTVAGVVHTITQAGAAPACTYAIDPPSRAFAAGSATAAVQVITQPGCTWTATSAVPWATIDGGSQSGAGTADVVYTVAANTTPDARTGSLTIAGQSHTITQAAVAIVCSYSLSPAQRVFDEDGGIGTVDVTTGITCGWTAVAGNGWVVVLTGSGTGTALISYQVRPGPMNVDRSSTVTVNGQVHTVIQRAPLSELEGGGGVQN